MITFNQFLIDTVIKLVVLIGTIGLFTWGLESEGFTNFILTFGAGFYGAIGMDVWYQWRRKQDEL